MAKIISFRTGKEIDRAALEPPAEKKTPAKKIASRQRGSAGNEVRKAMLAKIHVAKKQLGMTDEDYRGMLEEHYNVSSSADLDEKQLHDFILTLSRVGFKGTKGSAPRTANRKRSIPATLQPGNNDILGREPYMKKIEAMLAEKGRVEGTHVPWGYAVGILKKQSGGVTKCFEHATVSQLKAVIAALTYDARRKGRSTGTGVHRGEEYVDERPQRRTS